MRGPAQVPGERGPNKEEMAALAELVALHVALKDSGSRAVSAVREVILLRIGKILDGAKLRTLTLEQLLEFLTRAEEQLL